jgi:type IV pilus assembly protein PilZ
MSDQNKRQHARVPVSLKVSYPSRGDLQKDLVTDLSPGGLFIRTSKPLAIGTDVDLEVTIAALDPPINVRGRVVWLRQQGDKSAEKEGMGIQFTGIMGPVLHDMVEEAKKG